ncbi:MAG: glycosyltransferase family 1 protein [Parcubacteria group bacterium]|jgi:glycosyltransferase involved in cell wall biosynthesis
MRIGIDIRCLQEGRKTGVEEYTLNLLSNIFELDKKNEYVLFFNSLKGKNLDLDWLKKYPNVRIKSFHYPNKIFNLLVWYFNWPKIDRLIGGTDVFWMPNINFGAFSERTKLMLTMHDLSFEIMPENFPWKTRLWHFLINPKKLCQRADKIIAVSDSTKNDLEIFYKINSEKISVIHSAVSDDFKVIDRNNPEMLAVKEKYNLPYHFILYLGTIEPRKNIISIVKAYDQLRRLKNKELDRYKLAIAGANGWKEKGVLKEINKSPFKNDILTIGFIKPENKPYLYNLASLFVYPSFFEGFGFPPLEAMSSGVPVITSNNSSLPEIVGDSGILIDPEKTDELCKAMREILLNREWCSKLREKGLKRATDFDWQKSAGNFLEVVDKIKPIEVRPR